MVYSADYEKLFFLYSLQNPKHLKNYFPGFFSNDEIDSLADLSKKFYTKFAESPSKDQLKMLVEKSSYSEKVSKEMVDLIFDANLKEYDPDWLKRITQSWILWKNFDKQLISTVEYVKLQDVNPDNVDQIIHKAINMLNERGIINFDTNVGLNFFDPSNHSQQVQSKMSSGRVWIDRITGGGYDPKTLITYLGFTNIGKCLGYNEFIKIKNKITGEIQDISIGNFYSLLKK